MDNPNRAYFQFTNGGSISLAQKATAVNQVISDGQELNSSSAPQENESGHNIKLLHYNLPTYRGATSLIPRGFAVCCTLIFQIIGIKNATEPQNMSF